MSMTCEACGKSIASSVCPHCQHVNRVSLDAPAIEEVRTRALDFGLSPLKLDALNVARGGEVTAFHDGYSGFTEVERRAALTRPISVDVRGQAQLVLDATEQGYRLVWLEGGGRREVVVPGADENADLCVARLLPDGAAVICDREQNQLLVVGDSGIRGRLGTAGSDPGELDAPEDLVVGADGRVIVADSGNARVQAFSLNGEALGAVELPELSSPVSVAALPNGGVAVLDAGDARVHQLYADGSLHSFGERGEAVGRLHNPLYLAVNPAGFVFVSDLGGHRIQKFDASGGFVYALEVAPASGLAAGNFVAVEKDDLWIVSRNDRSVRLLRREQ